MPELMTGALRPDVELIPGEPPLLFDRAADVYYRISSGVADILAFLTGSMPLTAFREQLGRNGITVTGDELTEIILFLRQNDLLIPEYGEIGLKRERRQELREKTAFLRFSAAYLFFKLPPWRPERLFERIAPFIGWLASRTTILLLAIPAVLGYLLTIRDFATVRATFADTLSWAGLVKYFGAILFVKIIHEAAHSLAAIHFHCRVRGIGIGFMVFYPRLYTDTTDSWRLPRGQRLLIDGAGIIAELLTGGIAALLWTYLPPGVWRSTLFYIFAVSTISTLLVNGNPFIRYDGYYLLCDLLDMENLMTRSGEYIKQVWRRYCLGLGPKPEHPRGALLLTFGICSFLYRIFLYTSIILVIYHKFIKALAVILMILELYSIVIHPLWREVQTIRQLSRRSAGQARYYFILILLLIAAAILFFPLSWNISLPGETVPARRTPVTVTESGFLRRPLPRRAFRVQRGQQIFELSAPVLDFSLSRLRGILLYDETLLSLQRVDDRQFADGQITAEKTDSDRLGIRELLRRRTALSVRAETDGIFVPALPDLSAGAWLMRGQTAGEIVSDEIRLHAYAAEREVGKLKIGDTARVTIPDSLDSYTAEIIAIDRIPAKLSRSPLLHPAGGPIAVYPDEKTGGFTSVMPLYRVELKFLSPPDLLCGRTVRVTVRHSEALYSSVQQYLLSAFRREF